jgi:hypothetical protein
MRLSKYCVGFLAVSGALPFLAAGSGQRGNPSAPAEGKNKEAEKIVVRAKAAEAPEDTEGEGGTFRFPEDKGGPLLQRLLSPPETLPPEKVARPQPRRMSKTIEQPRLPLPGVVMLPSPSLERKQTTPPPQLLTPEPPLLGGPEAVLSLPQSHEFPVGERLRMPSADVEQPAALAPMAQPLPDRGALLDPSLAASRSSVLEAPLPERTTPAPFLRLTLPDPFENRDTVRLRSPLGKEQVPNTPTPRAPQR